LEVFLKTYATGPASGAESVVFEPAKDAKPAILEQGRPGSQPIAGSGAQSGNEILKVGSVVFDVATGKPLWQATLPVKVGSNDPTDRLQKAIAKKCLDDLTQAGFVRPGR
jgi:hypothetical protein